MTEIPEHLASGPKDGVTYPLIVQYCGNCSMPLEVSPTTPHLEWLVWFWFHCSTVNTIRTMRSAKPGWRSICQRSFRRCASMMAKTVRPVAKTRRNGKNAAERVCSRPKRSKTMDRKKCACREHPVARRRVWPLWRVLVHLVRLFSISLLNLQLLTNWSRSLRYRFEGGREVLRHKIRVRLLGNGRRWNCHTGRRQRWTVRYHTGEMARNRRGLNRWFGRSEAMSHIAHDYTFSPQKPRNRSIQTW